MPPEATTPYRQTLADRERLLGPGAFRHLNIS
jgi:hypothetical protein